jgi:hypothetical protein
MYAKGLGTDSDVVLNELAMASDTVRLANEPVITGSRQESR